MDEVIRRAEVELERQVPVLGQFCLCRLDIDGLNIALRGR